MAVKVFIDFDASQSATQGTAPTSWADCMKPQGVYQIEGVLAQNQEFTYVGDGITFGDPGFIIRQGRDTNSSAWGKTMASPGADSVNAVPIGVNRAILGIGDEVWCTYDLQFLASSDWPGGVGVTRAMTTTWGWRNFYTFRWGQLAVILENVTLAYREEGEEDRYTLEFSVLDNEVEVATVTVGDVLDGQWLFAKIHAKLDASTGAIEATINSVAQSASGTGRNTVSAIAANSTGTVLTADHIYFGAAVFYSSEGGMCGSAIDNILIDSAAFPVGRPRGRRVNMGASAISTDVEAIGTGATTVPDALINPSDAKAVRGVGEGAITAIDIGTVTFSGLVDHEEALIGANIYLKRPVIRTSSVDLRLRGGLRIDGVDYMGSLLEANVLQLDQSVTPPAEDYPISGRHEGVYTSALTRTLLPDAKILLEVVA